MTSPDRAHSDLSITVPGLPMPPLLHLRGTEYGLWVHGLPRTVPTASTPASEGCG